jgi:hypothetical protein
MAVVFAVTVPLLAILYGSCTKSATYDTEHRLDTHLKRTDGVFVMDERGIAKAIEHGCRGITCCRQEG